MRRIRVACLECALLAFNSLSVSAQSIPSSKEAAALIEKAKAKIHLALPGASPFHMVANVHYSFGDQQMSGTYEVFWTEAGRYREEFRLGSLSETDVALESELYVQRSTPYTSYQLSRVRWLMGLPNERPQTSAVPKPEVRSVRSRTTGGFCAEVGAKETAKLVTREICLDAESNQIDSEDSLSKSGSLESLSDDFITFGAARYPRHRVMTMFGMELEVNVTMLEPVSRFAESVFTPPAEAMAQDWCPNPSSKGETSIPAVLGPVLPNGEYAFYVRVKADGHVEKAIQLYPDGRAIVERTPPHALLPSRFPVHQCAGKAIEYETVYEWFALPL